MFNSKFNKFASIVHVGHDIGLHVRYMQIHVFDIFLKLIYPKLARDNYAYFKESVFIWQIPILHTFIRVYRYLPHVFINIDVVYTVQCMLFSTYIDSNELIIQYRGRNLFCGPTKPCSFFLQIKSSVFDNPLSILCQSFSDCLQNLSQPSFEDFIAESIKESNHRIKMIENLLQRTDWFASALRNSIEIHNPGTEFL